MGNDIRTMLAPTPKKGYPNPEESPNTHELTLDHFFHLNAPQKNTPVELGSAANRMRHLLNWDPPAHIQRQSSPGLKQVLFDL